MTKHRLARTLKREFDTKEDRYARVPAQLGNETGTVEITGRVNYHYARIVGQGKAFPVFNVRTAPVPDLWVWVGFDPDDPTTPWQVLGKIGGKLDYGDNNAGSTLPLHAETHRFLGLGARGGLDTLWVEKRQYMPLRAGPSSGLNVVVYRDVVWTGTQWLEVPAETVDLTSLVPSTTNQAIFVLFTIDNTGDIITTAGSEVDFDDLTLLDIPAIPTDTKYVLAAVRLYEGQTDIKEGRTYTDFVDLRFSAWNSGEVVSGGPGSGMINPMIATGDMITYDVQGGTGENVAKYNDGATAEASSEYMPSANQTQYAVYALEEFTNQAWLSGLTDVIPTCWWKCILPQEAVIKEIQVWQNDVSNYTASQFKLQVSDDDISYSDVDTFTPADVTVQETYVLTTPTRGKYWKLIPLTASEASPFDRWKLKFVGLYTADSENVVRLPIGAEGEILTAISGLPDWQDPAGVDTDAIHDNVSGEINALTEKVTPVAGDFLLLEDSADSFNKKKVDFDSLGGGGGHEIQDEGTPLTQRAALNFVGAGVAVTDDAGNDASVVTIAGAGGISEIFLTASGGWPSTTNGCAAGTKNEYPTNDVDLYSLDFDQTTIEYAQWSVWMPDDWDGGTITFKAVWTADGGSAAQTVEWNLQGRSYADDDAIDQSWGTAIEVSDALIATGDVHYTAESGAVTLAGTPAAGELVQFRAWRDAPNDNLAADARLLGIKVYFTKA